MTTAATQNRTPRPDAHPLAWGELTDEQQKCLGELLDALDGYASRSVSEEEVRGGKLLSLVRLDAHRWSNIYLIDGARGSGKTTVLLVFLKACLTALRGDAQEPDFEKHGVLRGHLLPTGILDLQPLPQHVPLIMWIATRLLEVLDAAEEDDPAGRRSARSQEPGRWEPGHVEESEARRAWRGLVEAIAGGWEGNLAERKSKLDPEAWAIELERSERERTTLLHCWRRTIDLILKAAHTSHRRVIDKDVRLVVPIDDADMNPQRGVELLETLRMLWHPRVVFLLTGHTELFRATLRAHYEGAFLRVAGGARFESPTAKGATSVVAALDRAVYDKVIPGGHRFRLVPLAPLERRERIKAKLAAVNIDAPDLGKVTLATYLDVDAWLGNALPEYLRQLLELGEELDGKEAPEAALQLWDHTCDAEGLSDEERRRVASLEGGLVVDLSGVNVMLCDTRETADKGAALAGRARAALTRDDGREYSARGLATLLLCASVAGDLEHDSALVTTNGTPYSAFVPAFAAGVLRDQNEETHFVWPVPSWRTPADWETFGKTWQEVVGKFGANTTVDDAAQWFLRTVIAVGRSTRRPFPTEEIPRGEETWSQTFDRVARCATDMAKTARSRALQGWAIHYVPLLCTPESGMSAEKANDLLSRWNKMLERSDVPAVYDYARLLREQRARIVWSRQGTDVAERLRGIDRRREGYAWASTVLGPEDRRIEEVRAWLSALKMPVAGDSVADVAYDLNLLRGLTVNNREEAGRLDAAMKVDQVGSTPAVLASIWRAMVTHDSLRGPHSAERACLVVAQGDHLLVSQGRNPAAQWNSQRSAHVQGESISARGASLSAPAQEYRLFRESGGA